MTDDVVDEIYGLIDDLAEKGRRRAFARFHAFMLTYLSDIRPPLNGEAERVIEAANRFQIGLATPAELRDAFQASLVFIVEHRAELDADPRRLALLRASMCALFPDWDATTSYEVMRDFADAVLGSGADPGLFLAALRRL